MKNKHKENALYEETQKKMKSVFLVLMVYVKFCLASSKVPLGYHTLKEIKLGQLVSLQLLVDKRINKKTELEEVPENARNAIIRFMKIDGIEISRKLLEKPKVDVELLKSNIGGNIFVLVTEDWSCEMGSYCGPITVLYQIGEGKFGKVKPEIVVMRSLKTGWKTKIGPRGFSEIFGVSCRPDYDELKKDVKFNVTYSHFSYDGTEWSVKRKTRPGCWESEEAFPKESLFP